MVILSLPRKSFAFIFGSVAKIFKSFSTVSVVVSVVVFVVVVSIRGQKSNTIVQKNRLHLVKAQNGYYNINISYAGEKLCCLQQ